jgi:hypothetical protein
MEGKRATAMRKNHFWIAALAAPSPQMTKMSSWRDGVHRVKSLNAALFSAALRLLRNFRVESSTIG